MPKFTVWRSGSGHVNCWNTLPICCGEYHAETFMDACIQAAKFLNNECWTSFIVDGIMYVENNAVNRYGQKCGKYGFFQSQEDAMAETMKHFSTPQTITDSIGNTILADVRLSMNEIKIQYFL